jgi:hypothetical protein
MTLIDRPTNRPCPQSWCIIAVGKWPAVATVQSLAAAGHLSTAVRALSGGHRRSSFKVRVADLNPWTETTMTDERMALIELIEKDADTDLVREMPSG